MSHLQQAYENHWEARRNADEEVAEARQQRVECCAEDIWCHDGELAQIIADHLVTGDISALMAQVRGGRQSSDTDMASLGRLLMYVIEDAVQAEAERLADLED